MAGCQASQLASRSLVAAGPEMQATGNGSASQSGGTTDERALAQAAEPEPAISDYGVAERAAVQVVTYLGAGQPAVTGPAEPLNAQHPAEELPLPDDPSATRPEDVDRASDRTIDQLLESAQPQDVERILQTPTPASRDPIASPEVILEQVLGAQADEPLRLGEVLGATLSAFPPLLEASAVVNAARGNELAQWGEFDTKLAGSSLNQFLGYYENYRQGVTLEQPLWWGADVFAGYRIGDGNFEPWYGNRETDEGGEFKVGMSAPLLQGLAVDKRRTNVRAATFDRQATDARLQSLRLLVQRDAAAAYWDWVAAGRILMVQQRLLELALERVQQIELRIRQGDLPRLESVNNQQLIAARRAKVIESERKIQASAIKLSVFYRDEAGGPLLPPTPRLPRDFPKVQTPQAEELLNQIPLAFERRPEIAQYRAKAESLRAKLALAQNELLPKLNALVDAGQDIGGLTSSKGDKQELVLMAGVAGEVPIQRRMAQGRIREYLSLLQANDANLQFAQDKIAAELRDNVSKITTTYGRIQQAERNVELAAETLRLGRIAFEQGDADVLILNLREQQLADAALDLIAAQAAYFEAVATYQAALGFDIEDPIR
jgi:outer membrane protein TolC